VSTLAGIHEVGPGDVPRVPIERRRRDRDARHGADVPAAIDPGRPAALDGASASSCGRVDP
jgi:hypothetical protein